MSQFKVKDGKISFNATRTLTQKQLITLGNMGASSRESYLMSLLGITKKPVFVDRIKTGSNRPTGLMAKRPGSVLNAFQRLIDPTQDHRPTDAHQGQWVGVEIECIVDGLDEESEDREDCHNCGGSGTIETTWDENGDELPDGDTREVTCERCHGSTLEPLTSRTVQASLRAAFAKAKVPRVSVKSDGSLHDDNGGVGVEITVLYNAKDGHARLQQVCDILEKHKARVNKTCGLHVHLDMRHVSKLQAKAIGKRLGNALPVLAKMQPQSRRNNRFCRLGVSKLNGERYFAVNMTALNKFGTIEVRLHAGTVLASKIAPWIDLLRTISTSPEMSGRPAHTFQSLIDRTAMPDALVAHVEARLSLHAPEMIVDQVGNAAPESQNDTLEVA